MIIAIDFDGVIHDAAHPIQGRVMGPPIPGALNALLALIRSGHALIIFTARSEANGGLGEAKKWLTYYQFPPLPVTNSKPICDLYIDDKAIRFENWGQVMAYVGSPGAPVPPQGPLGPTGPERYSPGSRVAHMGPQRVS